MTSHDRYRDDSLFDHGHERPMPSEPRYAPLAPPPPPSTPASQTDQPRRD